MTPSLVRSVVSPSLCDVCGSSGGAESASLGLGASLDPPCAQRLAHVLRRKAQTRVAIAETRAAAAVRCSGVIMGGAPLTLILRPSSAQAGKVA